MGNKSQRLSKTQRNGIKSARRESVKSPSVETVKHLGAVKSDSFRVSR